MTSVCMIRLKAVHRASTMMMSLVCCEVCVCLSICEDYDDLEFSIVSLDGRQWLFEAATLEVCFALAFTVIFTS